MAKFERGAFRSPALVALSVLALAAALSSAGCASDPVVAINDEVHPAGLHYIVAATFGPWHHGYYSVAVTIHNETTKTLLLKPSLFRLEGTPPTGFVAADRIPLMMGRAGYRMPLEVEPRCTAQGEIYYGIRGTETPKGKVRFVATLPDGDHTFDFTLVE
jgi:hypothetical protein